MLQYSYFLYILLPCVVKYFVYIGLLITCIPLYYIDIPIILKKVPDKHNLLNLLENIKHIWYELSLSLQVEVHSYFKVTSNIVRLTEALTSWRDTTSSSLVTCMTYNYYYILL